MSLIILTTSFPKGTPGAEAAGSFVADFCTEMASVAGEVAVVAPGDDATVERHAAYRVYRYPAPARPLSQLRVTSPTDLSQMLAVVRGGLRQTRVAVAEENARALLALWALPSGLWARRAAARASLPYAVWCLGSDIWTYGRMRATRPLLARILRDARFVAADGQGLAAEAADIGGCRCEFVPSSRRFPARAPTVRSEPPYRFSFIGRWHANKGSDLLMHALEMLDAGAWSRIERVTLCGGGPLEGVMRESLGALRDAGRPVELRGYVDREEAAEVLAVSDWLLIPSRVESIPVVFSDALAAGCPVLATPVGDLPGLVDGAGAGLCAEAPTAAGIAALIERALSVPARSFQPAVRQLSSRFGLPASARRFTNALLPEPDRAASA